MVNCPSCGAKNPSDASYCKECGAPLTEKETLTLRTTGQETTVSTTPTTPTAKPVPGVRIVKPVTTAPTTQPAIAAPTRIPSIGSCFYHPNLLASFICSRCGRQICRDCAKPHGDMIFCPQCYTTAVPPATPTPPPSGVNWGLIAVAISVVAAAAIGFVAWWLTALA